MRWWVLACGASALFACDDGGSDPTDAAPPPPPDMAPPPPPPPDLTGLFRIRQIRTGGDCLDALDFPAVHTVHVTSTDDTVAWGAIAGDRMNSGFAAEGSDGLDACAQPIEQTWQMQVSAQGAAFAGQSTWTYAACADQPACTVEAESRAERIGGHRGLTFSTVDLDPTDRMVMSSAVYQDAAWFGTASATGGRIWRLTNDGGVPFLEPAMTDGFRSVDPMTGGNNLAITAMARDGDRLLVGTWDAPAETADPLNQAVGDGFDLWQLQNDTWTAITTDGFDRATRERVEAIAALDDTVYLAVTDAETGPQVLDVAGRGLFPPGRLDCGRAATDLIVHQDQLHLAYSGCPDGVRILRFENNAWTPLGNGLGAARASLVSDGETLFALTSGPAALHRHVAGDQWVTIATNGLADSRARSVGRQLMVHDSDLLVLPVGTSAWVSKGGAPVRDLTRFATADLPLGHATSFERRLYLTTGTEPIDWNGPATQLLRADTLLTEMGPTTLRTQRDRIFDTARTADAACPRVSHWFNPALQHDQPVEVVLPVGVGPDDIVRLPAVYWLHGADAPLNSQARALIPAMASCLYGRRATIECNDAESNRDCIARCLTDRLSLIDSIAIMEALAVDDMVEMPLMERMAFVFAEYGAGIYVDAPDVAPWTPPDGRLGAWNAAVPALAEYVERCWELSIRGPDSRYVYGFGTGGLAAAIAVGSTFGAGVAHAPRFDVAALDPAWNALPAWSPAGPLAMVVDAEPENCTAQQAVCESATTCADWNAANQPGQVIVDGTDADWPSRLPAIARALVWLSSAHQGTASSPLDCAALPMCQPSACP